jgi:2-oxoacid:acceptor oxidoreductase gamma subunit (pyruvate/2-ketoisovalerate family)
MERELVMTGIGGQGIQLASAVLARAAVDAGREVQVFGSYGGMMRGGPTESTIVIADTPVEAPPTVGSAWSVIIMHHEHSEHALTCASGDSVVLINSTVIADQSIRCKGTVIAVPASDLAVKVGHVMTASMVMIGAYAAVTDLVALPSLIQASTASLPAYRAQHSAMNVEALRAGYASVQRGSSPAWPDQVAV